jgi:hypothetical protein
MQLASHPQLLLPPHPQQPFQPPPLRAGAALHAASVPFLVALELLFGAPLGQTEGEREALAGRVEVALARFRSQLVR